MAQLEVGIGAEISGLVGGLNDAEKHIDGFVNKVNGIGKIGDVLQGIGQKMTVGLTLPIVGLGAAAIKAFGDIESLQKGLEAVMGSSAAASAEFDRLKEVAKLPGLGMQEAVKGSINLQAIGISADKSREILSQFGNAVASVGKGRAEFERAIYGVQQLANTDFPLGEDLNIIKDALPQVSNLLTEAFGANRSDQLAAMGVSSKEVLDVILKGLGDLPRVSGGIKGAFENLGDSIQTSLGRIGAVINKSFDISAIIDKVTSGIDSMVSAFESLDPALQKGIIVLGGVVAAAGPLLTIIGGVMAMLPTLMTGIGALSTAFAALTGPIGLVTLGLVGVVAAVVDNWDKIKPYILNTINWFRDVYNESLIVRAGVQAIAVQFQNAFAIVGGVLSGAYSQIKNFVKTALDVFAGFGTALKGVLTLDPSLIGKGYSEVANAMVRGVASGIERSATSIKAIGANIAGNIFSGIDNVFSNAKLPKLTSLGGVVNEHQVEEETKKAIIGGTTKGAQAAVSSLTSTLPQTLEPIKGTMRGFMNDFGQEFTNWFDMTEAADKMKRGIGTITTQLEEATATWGAQIEDFLSRASDWGSFLNDAIGLAFDSVVDTIHGSFEAIGEAMATGDNVFKAFGNAVLGSIGNFLSDLGKMMIQYGVAGMAFAILSKALLNPLTAVPAAGAMIAAGAVLAAVGGAIKGAISGRGSSSSGSYSGSTSGINTRTQTGTPQYQATYSNSNSGGFNGTVVFEIEGQKLVGVLSNTLQRNRRLGGQFEL